MVGVQQIMRHGINLSRPTFSQSIDARHGFDLGLHSRPLMIPTRSIKRTIMTTNMATPAAATTIMASMATIMVMITRTTTQGISTNNAPGSDPAGLTLSEREGPRT